MKFSKTLFGSKAKSRDAAEDRSNSSDNVAIHDAASGSDRSDQLTALHIAVLNDDEAMAKRLLASNADVNAKNKEGRAPLHLARSRAMAELLLANGAEVDARDGESYTPLHLAAREGYLDVAKVLLSNNAQVDAQNKHGSTPHILAWMSGDSDMQELLERYDKGSPSFCPECGSPGKREMSKRGLEFEIDSIYAVYRCPACNTKCRLEVRQMSYAGVLMCNAALAALYHSSRPRFGAVAAERLPLSQAHFVLSGD